MLMVISHTFPKTKKGEVVGLCQDFSGEGRCGVTPETSAKHRPRRQRHFRPNITNGITMAPPRYRNLLELATSRMQWRCSTCTRMRSIPQLWRCQPTRAIQTSHRTKQSGGAAPSMEQMRKPFEKRNQNTLCVIWSMRPQAKSFEANK